MQTSNIEDPEEEVLISSSGTSHEAFQQEDVIFTNYYVGYDEVSTKTGSGLRITDFEVMIKAGIHTKAM